MSGTARDILDLIGEIAGEDAARRVARAFAGRQVNLCGAALRSASHPLLPLIGRDAMARLIAALGEGHPRQSRVRFPEASDSDHLRRRHARATLIAKLTREGLGVRATARKAKVSPRTVTYHRARMRREGIWPVGAQP